MLCLFFSHLVSVDFVVVGQQFLDQAVNGGQGFFWFEPEEGDSGGHVDDTLADWRVIFSSVSNAHQEEILADRIDVAASSKLFVLSFGTNTQIVLPNRCGAIASVFSPVPFAKQIFGDSCFLVFGVAVQCVVPISCLHRDRY